ncbi:UDP-N-acetylmuramoyl-L-alanyl-D-glutamate--2,6-diaminopimelate ligase [Microbacterium sp. X-17]|uniref:Mur ligase family protein n=1 Tax=Microbacterium sp. X-17 TaxID=3144404 RepID=UPI0031F50DB6
MAEQSNANRPARPPQRSIAEVASQLPGGHVHGDAVVTGLSISGSSTVPGDLFVAARGARTHGARHAPEALAAGAVAVLTDEEGAALLDPGTPHVVMPASPRTVLGPLSAWFYDHPAEAMTTVGITGTQGKTTTTYLVAAALADRHTGVIGSIGTRIDGVPIPSSLTTPEAPQLHALLALMRERGVRTVAAEVSSHSLVQGRVDGLRFDVGIFLNLGHDHLDFHGDQASYLEAKRELLLPAHSAHGLVCVDSSVGRRLAADPGLDARSFSIANSGADWFAEAIREDAAGTTFTVRGPDGARQEFRTPLRGDFHTTDILAAVAALAESGHPLPELAEAIAGYPGVEGRMQFLDLDPELKVVVDAGHKPEAINALLVALRPMTDGRVITVMGSNGNRDAHKRRLMGRLTAMASDILVVTDDDPEHEDPAEIRRVVIDGTRSTEAEVLEEGDRARAIRLAVSLCRPGDVLAVVGKGNNHYQLLAEGWTYFNDEEQIAAALREHPLRA